MIQNEKKKSIKIIKIFFFLIILHHSIPQEAGSSLPSRQGAKD